MKKKRIELLFVCAITLSTLSGCIKRSDRISLSDWLSSMTGSSGGSNDSSSDSSSGGEVVDENLEISFNDNMKTILEKYKEPDDEVGNVWVYYRYSTPSFYNDWKKMNELLQSSKSSDITKGEALYEKLKGTECVLLYIEFDNTTKNVKKCFKDYHWAYSLSDFSIHDQNKEIKKVDFLDKPVINYYMDRSDYPGTNKALDNSIKISYLTTFEDKSYILYSTNAEVDFNDNQSFLNWKDEFTSYKQSVQNKKIGEISNDGYIVEWDVNYEFPYGEYELGSKILTDKTFRKEAGDYSYISFSHSVDGKNVNERYLVHVENKKEITIDRSVTYMVPGAFNGADKVKSVIIQGPSTSYGNNQKYLTIPSNAFQGANKVSKVYLTGELVIEDYAFNGAPNAELYFSYGTIYKGNIETFENNYAKNTDGTKHIEHWGATMDQFYNVSLPEDYNYYYGDKLLYSASSYSEPSLSKIIDKLVYPSSSSEKWVANSIQLENEDEEEGIHNYRVSSWHNGTLGLYINHYDEEDVIASYSGAETKVTLPTRLLIDEDQIMDLLSLKIGDSAFSDSKIETIINLDRVTSIGSKAFASCTSLKNISIPKTVEFIGLGAFNGCSNLESIELPFIGQSEEKNYNLAYIFALNMNNDNYEYVPSALKTVQILEGLDSIPDDAFSNCSNITSISIPNSVHSIGNRAFKGCTSLKSIEFSNQLTTIGDAAFEQCTSLTDLVIPQSVNKIGKSAFAGCSQLTLYCEKEKQPSEWDSQWNYSKCLVIWGYGGEYGTFDALKYAVCIKDGTKYVTITDCDKSVTEIKIPEKIKGMTVTSIQAYAFSDCSSLRKIEIPNTIQSISEYAFYKCTSLQDFYYEGTTKNWCDVKLGNEYSTPMCYAKLFYTLSVDNTEYAELTSLTISSDSTTIDEYTFYNCSSLTSITIPTSVKSIGKGAFLGCASLTNVYYEGTLADWCNIQFVNEYSTPMYYASHFYMLDQNKLYQEVTKIKLPNTITAIGNYQFYGFNNVTEIILTANVTTIGKSAFAECSALESLTLPFIGETKESNQFLGYLFGATKYQDNATSVPSSLKSIILLDGCENIGENAFSNCSSLTNITIPNCLKEIGKNAFYKCSLLTDFYYEGNIDQWSKVKFGNEYSTPMSYAKNFYVLNKNNEYNQIDDIRISSGVTSIEDYAFYNCTFLTKVTIPSSVKSIGKNAFLDCTSLMEVYYEGTIEDWCNIQFINEYSTPMYYASHFYMLDGSKIYREITTITVPTNITKIGNYQFYGFNNITSIEIPSTVESIGVSVLVGCDSLKKITLPFIGENKNNLAALSYLFGDNKNAIALKNIEQITLLYGCKNISASAFYNCTSLKSIVLPSSINQIGSNAFSGCTSLLHVYYEGTIEKWCNIIFSSEFSNPMSYASHFYMLDQNKTYQEVTKIEIPNSITAIGNYQFYGFSNITEIIIPNSVTSIGAGAFRGCALLTNIEIPNGVTSIGEFAFSGCSSLTKIAIPNGVTSIKSHTFENCASLTTIIILSNLTNIDEYALYGCKSLKAIGIPSSVTSIGECAFSGCTSLTSITISDGVTSIGKDAFNKCTSLTNVYYEGTIKDWCNIQFTNTYSTPMSYAKHFYMLDQNKTYQEVTKIEIPDSITSIGNYQFYGFSNITEIIVPSSVTIIEKGAFGGCSSLKSITLPYVAGGYLGYIFGASYQWENKKYVPTTLNKVIILEGCISIGEYAFRDCSSLISIVIPSSVKNIDRYAFDGCTSLTNVYYEGTIKDWCNIQFEYYNSTPMCYAKHFYMLDQNKTYQEVTKIEIPNSITAIGNYQFYGFSNITEIIIPNSVTSIGAGAFSDCALLTDIKIPNGVTSIESGAFRGCALLTNIEIPNGVTSIGEFAFSGCALLTDIKIPNGVTSIGEFAFSGCSSLTKIAIPNGVTSIKSHTFENCASLTTIIILSNLTNIDEYAFYGCKSLKAIDIPSSVTSIGECAFYNCSKLTRIVIPNGVEYICDYVFDGCTSLTTITIPNSVKGIGNYAFSHCRSLNNIILPNGLIWIGKYAFDSCSSLTSMVIPSSVKRIGEFAFRFCNNITSIVIPSSVTSIGECAFDGSYSIYCEAESQPSGWDPNWNHHSSCSVVWGYKG